MDEDHFHQHDLSPVFFPHSKQAETSSSLATGVSTFASLFTSAEHVQNLFRCPLLSVCVLDFPTETLFDHVRLHASVAANSGQKPGVPVCSTVDPVRLLKG